MSPVEIAVLPDLAGGFRFEVTIDGREYAKGTCPSQARAAQQATHYAYMELSDPNAIGQLGAERAPKKESAA